MPEEKVLCKLLINLTDLPVLFHFLFPFWHCCSRTRRSSSLIVLLECRTKKKGFDISHSFYPLLQVRWTYTFMCRDQLGIIQFLEVPAKKIEIMRLSHHIFACEMYLLKLYNPPYTVWPFVSRSSWKEVDSTSCVPSRQEKWETEVCIEVVFSLF